MAFRKLSSLISEEEFPKKSTSEEGICSKQTWPIIDSTTETKIRTFRTLFILLLN